jgi:selenocysteine lyase/cysteine desulfurase
METFSLFRQRCQKPQIVIDAISKYQEINANIHRGTFYAN